jgi:LacI family repressor for deo operon, udp, cdd, tsx, nupC, and nupG
LIKRLPNTVVTQSGRRRSPTIDDIASLAGVSASTVSRSLSGLGRISDETREKVARAAKDLGYQANRHARSLRLQRSGIILVLIPDLGNQNYADLLVNLDKAAFEAGYSLMIGHTGVNAERSDALADDLFTGGIDGIILTSEYCPSRLREHIAAGESLPVIRTLSPTGQDEGIVGVQIDEVRAARDVVEHLADQGYRRIAHLSGPAGILVSDLRLQGWQEALAGRGLEERRVVGSGFRMKDGEAAARTILQSEDRPDAVFCANDEAAYGLIVELRRHGLAVPGDIAVAGFDDLTFSALFSPPLTTIRLPRSEMANTSIEQLARLIQGDAVPSEQIVPHQLMIRDSTMVSGRR